MGLLVLLIGLLRLGLRVLLRRRRLPLAGGT